jgi:hypothetical protein
MLSDLEESFVDFFRLSAPQTPASIYVKVSAACVNLKDCFAEKRMQLSTWFLWMHPATVCAMPCRCSQRMKSIAPLPSVD